MNILMISVRADAGGGPQHIVDLKNSLIESKPECKFWLACPSTGERFDDLKLGMQGCYKLSYRTFSIFNLVGLAKFCLKNRIDIVHSHGRGAGFYSRLLKFIGVRVVHTFHGATVPPSLGGNIRLLCDRWLAKLTDVFICVSEDEKQYVINHRINGNQEIRVVPNGINFQKFQTRVRPWSDEKIVVGCLARFDHQKGLDILIRHFAHFLKSPRGKRVVLLIGGGGDVRIREQIEKQIFESDIDEKVILLGAQKSAVDFFSKVDVYVSASRSEGLPLAVLEAFASRIPCLLSNVVGHRQLIDQVGCFSFELDSSVEFVKELTSICEDSAIREKIVRSEFEAVTSDFSMKRMADATLEIYRQLE